MSPKLLATIWCANVHSDLSPSSKMISHEPAPRTAEAYTPTGIGTQTLELLEDAERYNAWIFSWLEPYLGARCIELGAGRGTLTRFALARHRVLACEPASACRDEVARRFHGHPSLLGVVEELADIPATNDFDAIYSANVLEHIPDDVAILGQAARLLKRGGRFAAVVPAGAWLYSGFDAAVGHCRRYTRADRTRLVAALAATGVPLGLTTFEFRNPIGALGWALKMRWGGQRRIDPTDAERVERLLPLLRLVDRVPVPFGQSLVMVWERT